MSLKKKAIIAICAAFVMSGFHSLAASADNIETDA